MATFNSPTDYVSNWLKHTGTDWQRVRIACVMAAGHGVVRHGTVLGQVTATGKYVPWSPAASDGSQIAAAVNEYTVDTTATDVGTGLLVRDCIVVVSQMNWAPALTVADQALAINQLRQRGFETRVVF
jgi:hypothetical protein